MWLITSAQPSPARLTQESPPESCMAEAGAEVPQIRQRQASPLRSLSCERGPRAGCRAGRLQHQMVFPRLPSHTVWRRHVSESGTG